MKIHLECFSNLHLVCAVWQSLNANHVWPLAHYSCHKLSYGQVNYKLWKINSKLNAHEPPVMVASVKLIDFFLAWSYIMDAMLRCMR